MSEKFLITGKSKGEFAKEQEPRPRDGEILCMPLSVGLCGTDRLVFNGQMPRVKYPIIPCHEVSAIVVEDNSDLSLRSGTVVCINPYRNCGQCHACKLGRYNCCEFNQTLGVQRDGILREKFVVDADRVHVVPSGANPRIFCLAEPLALALHIVGRAGDVNGRWCLVAGVGNVGRMVVAVLSALKAKIIAWDTSRERLHQAVRVGAQVLINASEAQAESKVYEVTGNQGVSVAFESAGQSEAFEHCIKLAAYAGRVVVVGHSKQISNICGSDIVFKELDVVGSRNSLGKFPKAIKMLTENSETWEKMISHSFSFANALDGFRLTQQEMTPYSKVIIDFTEQ